MSAVVTLRLHIECDRKRHELLLSSKVCAPKGDILADTPTTPLGRQKSGLAKWWCKRSDEAHDVKNITRNLIQQHGIANGTLRAAGLLDQKIDVVEETAIINAIDNTYIPTTVARRDASDVPIRSVTAGAVTGSYVGMPVISRYTRDYGPQVSRLCTIFRRAIAGNNGTPRDFRYTSIQTNYNVHLKTHVDTNAEGTRLVVVSLGNYSGGRLLIRPRQIGAGMVVPAYEYEFARTPLIFFGRAPHSTKYFEGDRHSLVFFM